MSFLFPLDMADGEIGVSFNQNNTCLIVISNEGFNMYQVCSAERALHKIYTFKRDQVLSVARLYDSSLLIMVTNKFPRRMEVYNYKTDRSMMSYAYSNPLLSIKMNHEWLVICFENKIVIHCVKEMKVLYSICNIPNNPNGLFALSCSSSHPYLAYPDSDTTGEVQIFDTLNLQGKIMIPAHDNPLAALEFCPSGTGLATASVHGTIIRVFSSLDGTKLYEFRRGLKRYATIACLSFSTCGDYLVCSSSTETVHIFNLRPANTETTHTAKVEYSWMGYLTDTVTSYMPSVTSYLPTPVADVLGPSRAMVSVTLPHSGVRRICALTKKRDHLKLMIATQDGYLYVYKVPLEGSSGECQLQKKYDIRDEKKYILRDEKTIHLLSSAKKKPKRSNDSPSGNTSPVSGENNASPSMS